MIAQTAPAVFLSHSHRDKRVARRLVRRLTAHGIKVWIDERELKIGAKLPSSIRTHIKDAGMLLVVASQASAESRWVGLEIEFALEHGKTIIPFFIDTVGDHERFRDHLGVDATLPQAFADAVHALMVGLHQSVNLELPPPDPVVLEAELLELVDEEPDLRPLVGGCLDSEGLHQENMEGACAAAFHPLDEGLNALFDLKPNEAIAFHAAYGFRSAGAGTNRCSHGSPQREMVGSHY